MLHRVFREMMGHFCHDKHSMRGPVLTDLNPMCCSGVFIEQTGHFYHYRHSMRGPVLTDLSPVCCSGMFRELTGHFYHYRHSMRRPVLTDLSPALRVALGCPECCWNSIRNWNARSGKCDVNTVRVRFLHRQRRWVNESVKLVNYGPLRIFVRIGFFFWCWKVKDKQSVNRNLQRAENTAKVCSKDIL